MAPPRTSSASYSKSDGVDLKSYIEMRLDKLQEYIESRLSSIERASSMATNQLDERLGRMNEFREALKDQAGHFVTKEELALQIDRINAELGALKQFRAMLEGKASQSSMNIVTLISIISLLVALVGLILKFTGGG